MRNVTFTSTPTELEHEQGSVGNLNPIDGAGVAGHSPKHEEMVARYLEASRSIPGDSDLGLAGYKG